MDEIREAKTVVSVLGRTRHTRADHHRKIDEVVEALNWLNERVARLESQGKEDIDGVTQ